MKQKWLIMTIKDRFFDSTIFNTDFYTERNFKTSLFIDSEEQNAFYKKFGESIWSDSNFLQKFWGYLHLRADVSSYHNNRYYVDRGSSFVKQNDSEKIMPLFLKIISQSDLEKKVINKMIDSIEVDTFLKNLNKENFLEFDRNLQFKLFNFFAKHLIYVNTYERLIIEFTKIVKDYYNRGSSTEEIKQLLFNFISKIFELEKIKNELNLSSMFFAPFIIKNLSNILSDDFSHKQLSSSISKKQQELIDWLKKEATVKEEEVKEVDEMLDGGKCAGLTMSLFSQDSYDTKKAFRRAKFLHPMQTIGDLFQPTYIEIGKKVVKFPLHFSPILRKVCEVLNYTKADESIDLDAFLKEVNSKEGISDGIYQLIGNIAKNKLIKALDKVELWIHLPDHLQAIYKLIEVKIGGLDHIRKFLKLEKIELFKEKSIVSMANLLHPLFLNFIKDTKGPRKFNLELFQMKDGMKADSIIAHSIFISLDPIGFCDQNYINYKNKDLRFMKFDSIDDMMINLMFWMEVVYKDIYKVFHLTSFVKE